MMTRKSKKNLKANLEIDIYVGDLCKFKPRHRFGVLCCDSEFANFLDSYHVQRDHYKTIYEANSSEYVVILNKIIRDDSNKNFLFKSEIFVVFSLRYQKIFWCYKDDLILF